MLCGVHCTYSGRYVLCAPHIQVASNCVCFFFFRLICLFFGELFVLRMRSPICAGSRTFWKYTKLKWDTWRWHECDGLVWALFFNQTEGAGNVEVAANARMGEKGAPVCDWQANEKGEAMKKKQGTLLELTATRRLLKWQVWVWLHDTCTISSAASKCAQPHEIQ